MNAEAEVSDSPLVFTSAAAAKVASLIDEEGNPGLMLRVYIQGGGCSGFQYGFTFSKEVAEDDHVFEYHGVPLVVDEVSLDLLAGSEVD